MPGPIVERVERLRSAYNTPAGKKMFRYVVQSAITTVVSFVVLGLVYGVFKVWTEVPSTLFANVVAVVPSYYLNRNWVWGKGGRSHLLKEVAPFWAASLVGIGLSVLTSSEARHLGLKYFAHAHGTRTAMVEGANLLAFGVLWVLKFLVFNRLFREHPVDDAEPSGAEMLMASAPGVSPENS
jgi:putative flippase GtrA